MKVFKVVEKWTRYGTNYAIYKSFRKRSALPCSDALNNFIKENKEWFPRYKKDAVIKAPERSLGIFCFEFEEEASDFAMKVGSIGVQLMILKVDGFGPPTWPKRIVPGCGDDLFRLFDRDVEFSSEPPPGTITFKVIKVLE